MNITLDLTTVLLSLIAALSTICVAYVTRLNGKTAAVEAKVDLVEKTVNSNFQAQARELRAATDALSDATLKIATMSERERSADLATAKAQGMSEGILLPTPGQQATPTISVTNGPTAPVPVEIVAAVPVPVETEGGRGDHPPEPPPARRTSDPKPEP